MLNSYGGKYLETPNFNRLAEKSVQFNNHYIGSMPCMPARRDMHSGRLNFLHRSWGPLEPFDNSFPEILRNNKIYSHLVTDHYHYFEDGGATYHNRFNSWDFIRGQESDPWKAMVQPPLEKFKTNYRGPRLDWPQYDKVKETDDEVAELKANYYALIGLCDYLLGKILDYFDEQNLWDNTALILTTDHGFMLGEHDWWAKNRMPMYNEIAHIPLFIYHPEYKQYVGESRSAVTQNIDLMPTFLDMNNLNIPKEVKGKSLLDLLKKDSNIYTALYGYWGGGINITDGSYTYFHYPENFDQTSQDKFQYTLMPTHMRHFFSNEELRTIKIQEPFSFTKDIPVMKINRIQRKTDEGFKSLEDTKSALYNIIEDPGQLNPLQDQHLIIKLKEKMISSIKENDPPKELLANYFNI